MNILDKVISYINDNYSVSPEHTFKEFPKYLTFRHHRNNKWFALIMNVPMNKLGLKGDTETWVIDLKLAPELIGMLQQKPGFLPAYHMNKEHWITVVLNDETNLSELEKLIDESYDLTSK